jgi:hypothetical protein
MAVERVSGRGERGRPNIWAWILGAILVVLAVWALFSLLSVEDDRAGSGMGIGEAIQEPARHVLILELKPAPAG